jgi:hypothetical protein
MKSIMLALALLAGISAHASTVDSYSLPVTGAQTEDNFIMKTIQTKTEYRNETVANTCFRNVLDGYRTECTTVPQVVCYPTPPAGQACTTRYENRCYSVPQYRQEAYTCYQTVSVPYEVFSNNVKANLNVRVAAVAGDVQATNSCGINFSLLGANLTTTANCVDFIVLANKTNSESRVGDTLIQDRTMNVTLLDAKTIAAPTKGGIVDMKLVGQTVTFRTGNLTKNSNFSLKLFVQRRKLFKHDVTLISRNLLPSEYSFEKLNEDYGIVKINLSKLIGGINSDKKHVIRVDLNVNVDTKSAINTTLPQLSASDSITVDN